MHLGTPLPHSHLCALSHPPSLSTQRSSSLSERDHCGQAMLHQLSCMATRQNQAQSFCQGIAAVGHSREVFHKNFAIRVPSLHSKEFHFNVATARGRTTLIHSVHSSLIVNADFAGSFLQHSQVLQDVAEVVDHVGPSCCCTEFCFNGEKSCHVSQS